MVQCYLSLDPSDFGRARGWVWLLEGKALEHLELCESRQRQELQMPQLGLRISTRQHLLPRHPNVWEGARKRVAFRVEMVLRQNHGGKPSACLGCTLQT